MQTKLFIFQIVMFIHHFPILLIPISGAGTTSLSPCYDKDSGIIITATCLMSTLPENGVSTTANAAGNNGLMRIPNDEGARDNKFFGHSSHDSPILLNFRDRTPKRTNSWLVILYFVDCRR
jgi:hypothetical protein